MSQSAVMIHAALLALVLIALSANVVRLRQRHRVGIGGGSVQALERAIRAQANFCEYVPLALILLAMIEHSERLPPWALHALGGALLLGRILHGIGLSRSAGPSRSRVLGTLLTWVVLLIGAGLALALGLGARFGSAGP